MIIAIDTSTSMAGLSLMVESKILAEMTWFCGQNHTTQLLPALTFLLKQENRSLEEVEGLVVARGPGSYNGLRVGLGTAKGLAFSLNVPLVGISTLEVEAYQAATMGETGLPLCAILNAGRGEVAAAVFRKYEDRWQKLVIEHLTTINTLCSKVDSRTVFCGEYLPEVAPQIKQILDDKAILISGPGTVRRSGFLAELGRQRLQANDCDDPSTLQPLYLRAPAITQPKEPLPHDHTDQGGDPQRLNQQR